MTPKRQPKLIPIQLHNERVNVCRHWMSNHLEYGHGYDRWAGRCRSDRWGKRGRGTVGCRASLIMQDSRGTMRMKAMERMPKWREHDRIQWRIGTARSAMRLLCTQEYMKDTP